MQEILEIGLGAAVVAVTGALVGVEFGVTAFFHPILERLAGSPYVQARGESSRVLGKVMPFWYVTALVLQILAAVVWPGWMTIGAVVIMVVIQVLTLAVLVPINNRLAARGEPEDATRALARRWDRLHWIRVALLAVVLLPVAAGVR